MIKRKSQITLYLIIFLLMVLLFVFFINTNKPYIYSEGYNTDLNLKDAIERCISESAIKQIEKTGISESNLIMFKNEVYKETKKCTKKLFDEIQKINYQVQEGNLQINTHLNEETIILDVSYSLVISKDNQIFEFKDFLITIDKSIFVKIPNGKAEKEIILRSKDGKAELKIEKGTEIKDNQGNPVEAISLKIHDIKINGYDNNVVLSNVLYEGLPDGARFSKPVKLAFKIESNRLPDDISNYRIAKWDPNKKIWLGLPSNYNNGVISTEINGFSLYADIVDCNSDIIYVSPILFKQRYTAKDDCKEGWLLGEKIIGTLNFEDYTDYLENIQGESYIIYGYYELKDSFNYEFVNCMDELPDECKEGKDFKIKQKLFDKQICYYCNQFQNDICTNYLEVIQGVSCSENSDKSVFLINPHNKIIFEGKEQFVCDCVEVDSDSFDYQIIGYCDPRCVGGKIENEEGIYKIKYDFGNDCIAVDQKSKPLIVVRPSGTSSGDYAHIIYYGSTPYKIEEGELKIRGLEVFNVNKDSCAFSGVSVKLRGARIQRKNYNIIS